MKISLKAFLFIVAAAVHFTFIASALSAVPEVINYQGILTDSAGNPLTGTQTITFRLHGEAASATENAFLTETQEVIFDNNGRFSVTLGADPDNPIKLEKFDGQTYIGIQIGSDLELMPRQQLTSVAYALKAADTNPVGTILEFAGHSAPSGYLLCDGSEVSRTTYAALFAVIGTTYGAGDASTTFNLPDKRNRTSFGAGDLYALGENFGSSTKSITTANLPPHSHPASSPAHNHRQNNDLLAGHLGVTSGNSGFADPGDNLGNYRNIGTLGESAAADTRYTYDRTITVTVGSTGSGAALDIRNPGIATNFIIKY